MTDKILIERSVVEQAIAALTDLVGWRAAPLCDLLRAALEQPQGEQEQTMITPEQVHTLALQAGAARFYPEQQAVKQELYLVGQWFLEKFAELVEKHKLEQELEQKFAVQTSAR